MKIDNAGIIFIISILLIVTISGCTQSNSSHTARLATFGDGVDYNRVHWYSTQTIPIYNYNVMNMLPQVKRLDFDFIYDGTKCLKVNTTKDSSKFGVTIIENEINYYDHEGNLLGGHLIHIVNGKVIIDEDIPPHEANPWIIPDRWQLYLDYNLTYLGEETVRVPLGTYTCEKYDMTGIDKYSNYTVWFSDDVPLPIKMNITQNGAGGTIVLTGWG